MRIRFSEGGGGGEEEEEEMGRGGEGGGRQGLCRALERGGQSAGKRNRSVQLARETGCKSYLDKMPEKLHEKSQDR